MDFLLVITSPWFTSKALNELFLILCQIYFLLPHRLQITNVIMKPENFGGNIFRKYFMCVTSEYPRELMS